MKNARRAAAAAGHKTTQRRRRPPVRRRTALIINSSLFTLSILSNVAARYDNDVVSDVTSPHVYIRYSE